MILRLIAAALLALLFASLPATTHGLEAYALKEGSNPNVSMGPCALAGNTDGTAANYRWYNVCSGYIWIFSTFCLGEGFGVWFGGPLQPEVNDANVVKRAITYWRNVVMNYSQTVDVFVDVDSNGDGCPDANLATHLNLDPGLRWSCSEFNVPIPAGVTHLVVKGLHDGGAAPTIATDGPFSEACNPNPVQRSYYYGCGGSACIPWVGPSGRFDNFLFWLVLDRPAGVAACCFADGTCQDLTESACAAAGGGWLADASCAPGVCQPVSVESKSWGKIKGLFR